jgi:hypothetical protein
MGLIRRKLIYNFSTFGFYNVVILKFHLVNNKLLSNIINIVVPNRKTELCNFINDRFFDF